MMTFVAEARAAQVTWKRTTATLPDEARSPGRYQPGRDTTYPFCLPLEFSEHNLLPEARELGLSRFASRGVAWHVSANGGPTTHLLSSQVQCVNALAPLMHDEAGLRALLAPVLPVAEVLPFHPEGPDPEDLVVFEWIGLDDYLGESRGRRRTPGANTTSVDAAVRYRNHDDEIEIGLIEWKYVERYSGGALPGGPSSLAARRATYERWWTDSGPLRTDRLDYEDIFTEPVYQLFRQHCLAQEMERAHELGADNVRVLVVAPRSNVGYWNAVPRRFAGDYPDLPTFWSAVLRRPDRFRILDSGALAAPTSPCAQSFQDRYAHLASGTSETALEDVAADTSDQTEGDGRAAFLAEAHHARMAVQRVFGDGAVLQQLTEGDLSRVDDAELQRLAVRLREIADLARQLRAEEFPWKQPISRD